MTDGASIIGGPQDWQILQRNESNAASLTLGGTWGVPSPEDNHPDDRKEPVVVARVVCERTGIPASEKLDWQPVQTRPDGTWEARVELPAGGLYRIETGVNRGRIEWAYRGDTVNHLGVGDLWVIAGQSNAAGYGRGYVDDLPEIGVHLLGNDEQWRLATHPLNDTRRNLHPNREQFNPRHSPFLAFGRLLKRELGIPIGLIQTALGGSGLELWNPSENREAPLYKNLLHCVRLAGGRVAGVVWYQGEADAVPEKAPTYLQRFSRFVESLRHDLAQPDLPIITAQLNRHITSGITAASDRAWSQVREAQRQAARELPRVAVIATSDLPLCDEIHTSPAGNLILGRRFATVALGMKAGNPRRSFPEIAEASTDVDRKAVFLKFAPVRHRLHADVAPIEEFVVEDEGGVIAIQTSEFVRSDQIRLTLARPLRNQAVVHGQWGANPPSQVYEVEENQPVLGFHAFPIRSTRNE